MPGMSGPALSEEETRALFLAACRAELQALKPGNVHVHAGGHGMEPAHLEAGAEAAAPWIAAAHLSVGARIQRGVEAAMAAAGCNTNLGILLLSAPLAAAAQAGTPKPLRDRLRDVLANLEATAATSVFAAIRLANPGGLGSVSDQDVAAPPTAGLIQAMARAADRDRIAHAYVNDFAEIFEFGLPALAAAGAHGAQGNDLVSTLHMAYLAHAPDSHIARKHGSEAAKAVMEEASGLAPFWQPVVHPEGFAMLLAFDAALKSRNLNPGTTADLVVATLFAASICDRLGALAPPNPLSSEGTSR